MERERARFLVCAARGEGVRAHQHGVVQRLAVVGVAGLRLKLVGVHRAPATVETLARCTAEHKTGGRYEQPRAGDVVHLT